MGPLPFGRVVLLAELGLPGKPEEDKHNDSDDAVNAERNAEGPATNATIFLANTDQGVIGNQNCVYRQQLQLNTDRHLPSAAIVQAQANQPAAVPPGITPRR